MKPVLRRSSGVFRRYMTVRKMTVDAMAYSISPVAPNAMAMRETRRKILFPKSFSRRSGMAIALEANKPWYRMMRENTRGWDLMKSSVGLVTGEKRFLI